MLTFSYDNLEQPIEALVARPGEDHTDNWNLAALEVRERNMEWLEMASLLPWTDTVLGEDCHTDLLGRKSCILLVDVNMDGGSG